MENFKYLILLLCVSSAHASDNDDDRVPDIPTSPNGTNNNTKNGDTFVFLMTSVNNSGLNDLVPCKVTGDNKLAIKYSELKKIRITLAGYKSDQWVNLDEIPGLNYNYDKPKQNLFINVNEKDLDSYSIDLGDTPRLTDSELNVKSINATILNYSAYNTTTKNIDIVSGSADFLLNSPIGNFYSNSLYSYTYSGEKYNDGITRLDSGWQYIDPIKIRSYLVGDYISNTTEWSNSLRITGIQISSAYAQRSDIVTAALPQFSGSSALPSTLDLYVNQQKIYSGDIPSGRFDLKSLPFISGSDVTLVTKDSNGRQVKTKTSYYYSPKILGQGINEYSLDVGIPRYNYGSKSNDYDNNVLFSAASLRSGFDHNITTSFHAENSTDGMSNMGAGIAKTLLGRGVVNADLAGSTYKGEYGALSLVGLEGRISRNVIFNTSYQKTYQHYYDLARVANIRYQSSSASEKNQSNYIRYINYSPYADTITRAGMSYNILSGYMLSSAYTGIKYQSQTYKSVSLSLNGGLTRSSNFYISLYKNLQDNHDYGMYLTFQFVPGQDMLATSSYNNSSGSKSYRQQLDKLQSSQNGSIGWGGYYEKMPSDNFGGYLQYRSPIAYLTANYDKYQTDSRTMVSATGSAILTNNNIYFANKIGDSYAIVKNAGPKSHIINGGVDLGETNGSGGFLIPDLQPYTSHDIYLDPANLPLDWQPITTNKKIITGYNQGVIVDFDVKKELSAVVKVIDSNNQSIKPGYNARLNNNNNLAIVGYDGEVYITGLQKHNTLEIDLLDKGKCQVEFSFNENSSPSKKLGPYLCH